MNNLESIYEHIENEAIKYKYPHQIATLFRNLRDKKIEEDLTKEAEIAQWEIDFFHFVLKDENCHCTWSGTKDNGEIFEYPTFTVFTKEKYEYLKSRLENVTNPILKARYAHILWASPKKDNNYAQIAIDSYLELVEIYSSMMKENQKENYELEIIHSVKCAFYLSSKVKYKIEEVKSKLLNLVLGFDLESEYSHILRNDLINLMLKHKKRFMKADFQGIDSICWKISENLFLHDNLTDAIQMFELGEKVEKKLCSNKYEWRKKIAEIDEELLSRSANDIAAIHFCKDAIQNYKKIRNNIKVNELEKKLETLKATLNLTEFKTEIEIGEHIKICKKIAKNIVKENTENIIGFLILNKDILPRKNELEERIKVNAKHAPILHLIPTTVYDQSGNSIQHFSQGEEKSYFNLLEQYKFELQMDKIHLIDELIFLSVLKDKLNPERIFNYFQKYSWFGKDLSHKIFNKKEVYNWLELLMPAIHDYFFQLKLSLNNNDFFPNLVLAIDSLTLKIEGLLRDFCRLCRITTSKTIQDKQGNQIVQEKDIHCLLYEDPVKELFDEDDLLFFRFLLIEKAGYNLRNKIAHSLMSYNNYCAQIMNLLFICILKIGKYDFKRND